jgi:FMN phosphatase YigB (HAD superfamily)
VLTYFDLVAVTQFLRPLLPISVFELMERWQAYGAQAGFPRSVSEEATFFAGFWGRICGEFGVHGSQRAALYGMDYTRYVCAYPEVPGALATLHAGGLRIGVLSNFSLATLEASLDAAGIGAWIDAAAAATVIGAAKPAAEAYAAILHALDVRAEEAIYFDDEPECVEGARAVGMRSFLVDRMQRFVNPEAGVIASLAGVPALLSSLSK